VKLKFQHTGTWWAAAWLPCHMCYHPAIFLNHLCLNEFSFPQGNIWHTVKKMLKFQFFFLLIKFL
jgi:hypothetical protein